MLVTAAWFVLATNMSIVELVTDLTYTSRMVRSSQPHLLRLHLQSFLLQQRPWISQAQQDQPQRPLKFLPPLAFLLDGNLTDVILKESMAAYSATSSQIVRLIQSKTVSTHVLALVTVLPERNLEQCFCENNLYNGAAPTAATNCNMACTGNANELCGAGNYLSVYNVGNLTAYQAPTAQKTNLPGSWNYQGCYTDNVNNVRALFWQIILTNNNTATSCLGLCQQYGYMAAGMEYCDECYCGDASALNASGSTQAPETDCQVPCSGDNPYYCGGGSRLPYYTWTGTPLQTFNYPTGPAMGSYQFLVGGVVVPLITTIGINNKVVFMEKSGTGAPNTTGTYELDLTAINNFTLAWRPLRVKSDIFCSAVVTLPDKAGRQLNIGGWAGASTYGVRIYWPDGSDGVWGTNDWQENVNEVSLLAGRWYV
jgi:hypothetical protein